ncbi:Hsp20/alpha crystallin family protein [Patescibacteria group bacterium]|nr:Hsp20/alpha crystallin family protein [Patescibacteria group bacterium]
MNKKSSFFEKLTGASWSDEDIKNKKDSFEKKPEKVKFKKDKSKGKLKAIKKTFMKEKPFIPKKEKSEKETEEWLSESEGQLTIDVYQTPNEIVIKSTIAGVKPEDIDISMTNDMITIKGNREKDDQVKEEDYYYQECYWGPFSRSIILPVDVEVDDVDAAMKNGILTIKLPKIEKVKTKKIKIKSE